MTEIKVVGIGELLWDMLPTGKVAGGAPANFAYFAGQEGADACVVSAVGDDALGREILSRMDEKNIKHIVTIDREHATGTVAVTVDRGIPAYVINENVAWDYIRLTPDADKAVKNADVVCFGTLACRHKITRESVLKALRMTKAGAIRFFDVNLRGDYYDRKLIEELLSQSTVLKLNDEEAIILRRLFAYNGDDVAFIRFLMREYALDYAVFTAGADHSRVYAKDGESFIKTPRVDVVDTVGAGDAFSGAFTVALLQGKPFKEAHRRAVDSAAAVCMKAGAWG